MEEKKDQENPNIQINGVVLLCTTLVIGYLMGRMNRNAIAVGAYRMGVLETLSSLHLEKH